MFPKGERPSDKIFNKIFFCTLLSAIIEIDDLRRKIHNVIFFFFSFSLFSPQNGEVWEKEGKYGVYFTKVPPTPSNNSYEFKYTYSRSFPQKHLYKSQEASKEKKILMSSLNSNGFHKPISQLRTVLLYFVIYVLELE